MADRKKEVDELVMEVVDETTQEDYDNDEEEEESYYSAVGSDEDNATSDGGGSDYEYNAQDSPDDEYSIKKNSDMFNKMREEPNKISYTEFVTKRSNVTAICERDDASFACAEALGQAYLNLKAKVPKSMILQKNTQTFLEMREDMFRRTDTPFYPWFQDHVKRSAKRSFTADYFMLGLVEEFNKYNLEKRKGDDWPPVGKQLDEVISRAGNVYWYIYGLCGGMENIIPATVDGDGYDWYYADVMELLLSMCGLIRKRVQGDQDWAMLRPQVQASVSRLLRFIKERSVRFSTPELAMRTNIAKIKGRGVKDEKLREEVSYSGVAIKIPRRSIIKVTDIRANVDMVKEAKRREYVTHRVRAGEVK